ncbi:DUF2325 domain-containing protein [Granulicatella seriolae]|uniref:DUF2325 domain-containing protein n=1 Tax=Granulicatella seriolae TaxID=2967226 RepID=A0ABT1WKZ3_9LACT|nr:DUF2325 domain-containing protein [Granulicatella seriolae]
MKKDQFISLVKGEIQYCLDNLTSFNVEEISARIKEQLAILDVIKDINFLSESNEQRSEVEKDTAIYKEINGVKTRIEPMIPKVSTINRKEKISANGKIIEGYFQQKIRGGVINKQQELFVPEKAIRDLGIEEGDFVRATYVSKSPYYDIENKKKSNRVHYDFVILQKNTTKREKVREIHTFLTVKKHEDLNRLYIEFPDKESEIEIRALISDGDRATFRLEEGDIIDYAHQIDNSMIGNVIWKYKIEEIPTKKEAKDTVVSKKKKVSKTSKQGRPVKPIFKGLTVLTIGGTNKNLHKNAKEEIIKRDGTYSYLSGNESHASIISQIRKADLIMIYTQSISHEAMYLAKEHCKKMGKVHGYTKNIGGIELVRRLSVMKKKLVLEEDSMKQV